MRSLLRSIGWRFAPELMANRARVYELRLRESLGHIDDARAHLAEFGDIVVAGPCAGLRYPEELVLRADAPARKLLGIYEQEIQAPVAEAFARVVEGPRSTFVDIGVADGYYAVGAARAGHGVRVVGYDLAASARTATQELAHANGVCIELRAAASAEELTELGAHTGAVLCDIEGAEADVVTPEVGRALAHALLIVEVHVGFRPDADTRVRAALADTHTLERIDPSVDGRSAELRSNDLFWLIARPRTES